MDPQQRERIRDDLKGILKGELRFDDLTCALYSTDASIFEVLPAGVVLPRDEEDVQALVRYAAEHQVPLVPRGAGTGLAGEALGESQHRRSTASARLPGSLTCYSLSRFPFSVLVFNFQCSVFSFRK